MSIARDLSPTEIDLLTIPSTYINARWGNLSTPYRRIVSVRLGATSVHAGFDQHAEGPPKPERLVLAEEGARRLKVFFRRFIAQPSTEKGNFPNCFTYGIWMEHGLLFNAAMAIAHAQKAFAGKVEKVDSLPSGICGAVTMLDSNGTRVPVHTVVGTDNPSECSQTIAYHGYMGITTYDQAIANQQEMVERLVGDTRYDPATAELCRPVWTYRIANRLAPEVERRQDVAPSVIGSQLGGI